MNEMVETPIVVNVWDVVSIVISLAMAAAFYVVESDPWIRLTGSIAFLLFAAFFAYKIVQQPSEKGDKSE